MVNDSIDDYFEAMKDLRSFIGDNLTNSKININHIPIRVIEKLAEAYDFLLDYKPRDLVELKDTLSIDIPQSVINGKSTWSICDFLLKCRNKDLRDKDPYITSDILEDSYHVLMAVYNINVMTPLDEILQG